MFNKSSNLVAFLSAVLLMSGCTNSDSDIMSMGPKDTLRTYFLNSVNDTQRLEGRVVCWQGISGYLVVSSPKGLLKLRNSNEYQRIDSARISLKSNSSVKGHLLSRSSQNTVCDPKADNGSPDVVSDTIDPSILDAVGSYFRQFPQEPASNAALCDLIILHKGGVTCVLSKDSTQAFLQVK